MYDINLKTLTNYYIDNCKRSVMMLYCNSFECINCENVFT